MSKLTDKLKKVGQSESTPMGFGFFATRTKNPPMLLLAELASPDPGAAQQALADGADVLLLGPGTEAEQVRGVLAASGEAVVGITLAGGSADVAATMHTADSDFLVLTSVAAPAAVLQLDGPGKLLEVDPDWADTTLRAVEGLPLDGVLLRVSGPLTVEAWMRCLRVGGLTRKTLLVTLTGPVDTDTLRSLRDAGVSAVVVEPGAVAEARRLIDSLPSPKRPKDHRAALLPASPRNAPPSDEDDQEEE